LFEPEAGAEAAPVSVFVAVAGLEEVLVTVTTVTDGEAVRGSIP